MLFVCDELFFFSDKEDEVRFLTVLESKRVPKGRRLHIRMSR